MFGPKGEMTTHQTEPVIEIVGLTKDFRVGFMIRAEKEHNPGLLKRKTIRALDHLSLEVYAGEIFGFLGPNGAGKTTTLKLLMGLVYPTEGSARILGRPIEDVATRARIGYLPENPYFYDYLSGRELLFFTAALFGLKGEQARSRVDVLLEAVGLDRAATNRQLRKYSKGMLQRIGIAQALVNDPEVVFLDEPMSGLDPVGRREVRDLLLDLREKGKTIFFSSHILSDVEAICDRCAVIKRGKLAGCGTLDDLTGGQQQSIEVIAINTDNSILDRLAAASPSIQSVVPTPGGAQLILDDETGVDEALGLIRRSGGRLVSVNPRKTSLEDVFFVAE